MLLQYIYSGCFKCGWQFCHYSKNVSLKNASQTAHVGIYMHMHKQCDCETTKTSQFAIFKLKPILWYLLFSGVPTYTVAIHFKLDVSVCDLNLDSTINLSYFDSCTTEYSWTVMVVSSRHSYTLPMQNGNQTWTAQMQSK